jgi:lysophospholipase L1-like esterase
MIGSGRVTRAHLRVLLVTALVVAGAAAGALAPVAGAVLLTPVTGSSTKVLPGSRYLALGDSVTFGYEEATVVPAPNYKNAASFLGYPEQLGAQLRLKVTNAACPGETSASLINASAPSNGCENAPGKPTVGYRRSDPLHAAYKGSQLAFALSYLKAHKNTRLVSLMIGANDLFLCQEETKDRCLAKSEFQAALKKVARNVGTTLSGIRKKAGYRGQLVIVNYYALNYASAVVRGESRALNAAVDAAAKPFGVSFADGYGTFQAAALHSGSNTCTAGLLTQLGTPSTCGVHPSYAGQALLAQAVLRAIRL